MTRVDITDDVREQLAQALDHDEVDHPLNRSAVQYAAWELDLEALATFVGEADAATYYEALQRVGVDPRPGGEKTGGYDRELDG
ncbi:MAG: hypothetical protein ABEJ05_00520 [Haloglomus sp.]